MRKTGFAMVLLPLFAAAVSAAAPPGDPAVDRVVLFDRSVRSGRVVSFDATDLLFQEHRTERARMIPLAEVREIRWADGSVHAGAPVDDLLAGEKDGKWSAIRSSPYVSREDLVLTKRKVAWNSIPRGIAIGTLATLFADGDDKMIAFGAGFTLQFGLSFMMGW